MTALSVHTFDLLFPAWQTALLAKGIFSLTDVSFITPGGVILLFCGLVSLYRTIGGFTLFVPYTNVRQYLARVGFFAELPSDIKVTPRLSSNEIRKPVLYNGNNSSLLELKNICSKVELSELLDRVVDTVESRLNYSEERANDIGIVVSEIWQNSLDHSDGSYSAGILQVYGTGPNARLELAIGDDGVGIANSLASNEDFVDIANDCDAILTAIKPSVSRLPDKTRGNGLTRVIEKAARQSAILDIRSGSAKFRSKPDRVTPCNYHVPHLAGTQVIFSLDAA